MTQLPPMPGQKIIREAQVEPWIDGYAFLEAARAHAEVQKKEMSDIREESRREGYEAGFKEGARDAAILLTTTTARVNNYVAALDQELASLTLSIVARIFGEFDDADLVVRLVRHALKGFQRERDVTLSVAPGIAEDVSERISREFTDESLNITVLGDPSLSGTKCVLSNAIAVVDASLETQLSAIREALVARHDQRQPE